VTIGGGAEPASETDDTARTSYSERRTVPIVNARLNHDHTRQLIERLEE
jgi:hypothetical protein